MSEPTIRELEAQVGAPVDPALVAAVLEELDTDERNVVVILYYSPWPNAPIADLSGRYRELGLLDQRSTLSRLGRAVAKRILEDDPEARADGVCS